MCAHLLLALVTHMLTSRFIGCIACLLFAGPALAAGGGAIDRGEQILKSRCQRCHAIGVADESTHPQAPPFRTVMQRYAAESLEEALAEGIVSGHPEMPVISFEPDEIGAIVDYLNDLAARAQKR